MYNPEPHIRIKLIRHAMGMTQTEFATWMKVSSQALVSDWECGRKTPTPQKIELAMLKSASKVVEDLKAKGRWPIEIMRVQAGGKTVKILNQCPLNDGLDSLVGIYDEHHLHGARYRIEADDNVEFYIFSTLDMKKERLHRILQVAADLIASGATIQEKSRFTLRFKFPGRDIEGRWDWGVNPDRNHETRYDTVYLRGEDIEHIAPTLRARGFKIGEMDDAGVYVPNSEK